MMRWIIYFLLTTALIACNGSRSCTLSKKDFMNAQAKIHLNLSLDQDEMIAFTNKLIPDTLFNGDIEEQDLQVLVKKNGIPALTLEGQTAQITLPIDIKASKSLGFMRADAEGSLFLTLKSTVDIASDWSWTTQTEIVELDWVKEPKLNMMGLKISVKSMIDSYLESSEKDLTDQIDQAVADNQLLKNAIAKAQSTFEWAYALDPDQKVQVQIMPKWAGLTPFEKDGKTLKTSVALQGRSQLINEQNTVQTPVDTPTFTWLKDPQSDHTVSASVALTEQDIQELAREHIVGESFDYRGKKVEIKDFDLKLINNRMEAKIVLGRGIQGTVSFKARPAWDEGKNEVYFCDAELDANIDKGLSKFLLWLGKSTLKKRIIKEMEDNINLEIEGRIKEVNKYLRSYKMGERMRVRGEVYDYDLDPIIIEDRTLNAGIHLDLRGSLFIDDLKLTIE